MKDLTVKDPLGADTDRLYEAIMCDSHKALVVLHGLCNKMAKFKQWMLKARGFSDQEKNSLRTDALDVILKLDQMIQKVKVAEGGE